MFTIFCEIRKRKKNVIRLGQTLQELLYSLLNWYSARFSFPPKGLKYFLGLLSITGIKKKVFCKKLHNGLFIHVSPQDHIQQQLLWYGFYEKKYVLTWETFVGNNSIVADIGANIGYYTLVASQKALSGHVYAFEPSSQTFTLLRENIAVNKLGNVSPVCAAVTNANNNRELFISADDNKGMTGLSKPENFGGSVENVVSISLDEWYEKKGVKTLDLVKIDIEGAELLALQGMTQLIQKMKPVFFIEVCNELQLRFDSTAADIYIFFEKLDYQPYRILAENKLQRLSYTYEDELVVFLPLNYLLPGNITLVT